MKKKYLLIEFIIVFLFLAVPPLFVSAEGDSGISFSKIPLPYIASQLAFAVLLDFSWRCVKKNRGLSQENSSHSKENKRFFTIVLGLKWFSLTLGILLLVYAGIEGIYLLFPDSFTQSSGERFELPPGGLSGFSGFAKMFVFLAVSAYFEEVLYREFLPESLLFFFEGKKIPCIISEIFVIVIFAFSHRYQGILAVVNAALSGGALRLCRKKTGLVYTGTLAHFAYNFIMVIFLSLGA